jgi:Cys-tRNA(Pro)/Cys-tRNA(Cys) deacylase
MRMATPTPRMTDIIPHPLVASALAKADVPHTIRCHADCPFPILSPKDFARCLGWPLGRITKSLFLELTAPDANASFAMAVCGVVHRVDFSILARRWNVAHVKLASRASLAEQLGYPPTGVSPLGVNSFPVAIDEAVFSHETVLVGGGVAGVEVEIAPVDLQRASGAARLAFALF